MQVIDYERYYILITYVLSFVFALSIFSRKDKEERWLMPMCLLTSIFGIALYIIFIFYRSEFATLLMNQLSTLLRIQSNTTHLLMLFVILSRGSKLWKR